MCEPTSTATIVAIALICSLFGGTALFGGGLFFLGKRNKRKQRKSGAPTKQEPIPEETKMSTDSQSFDSGHGDSQIVITHEEDEEEETRWSEGEEIYVTREYEVQHRLRQRIANVSSTTEAVYKTSS